jgi:site-specific DNA-methyltransferase (adenine-specific)
MTPDLRLGSWQDVLADVGELDALICDPPYSERTHEGRRTGSEIRQSGIHYDPLTPDDAAALASFFAPRIRRWAILFCDHQAREWHAEAWAAQGWYVCGPVRWVKPDAPPRMCGDGPTVSTEDILVARSAGAHRRHPGSRPGHYVCGTASSGRNGASRGKSFPGAKPLPLMQEILQDYTLPGDLVCDPFSGSGTTARACMIEGRRFVGAEIDPKTHALAMERIRGLGPATEQQPSLFGGGRG